MKDTTRRNPRILLEPRTNGKGRTVLLWHFKAHPGVDFNAWASAFHFCLLRNRSEGRFEQYMEGR